MKKIYFAIALHFHQPVGNFKEIFERACLNCYKPFLEFLCAYPSIKATLHISGPLMEYLSEEHKEVLGLVRGMVLSGQAEVMGGAYYEPILTAIPPDDMTGQIRLMSGRIEKEFFRRPAGMWVPERVWGAGLPKYLRQAGMRYCVLDDTHLLRAGVEKNKIHNYFLAKYGWHKIAVFPSDKALRYTIPFKPVKETMDYFKEAASKEDAPLLVYGDDAEKFGEWPGTYDWVYKDGWLKRFFDALAQNNDWIETLRLSDCLKMRKPRSTLNIPEASYDEMMEWSEGSWFNFLKIYPESKHMHDKMEYVSRSVKDFKKRYGGKERERAYWANIELYRGQSNCAYWHGVFGGLYMYHLRSAVYNHLIAAENIIDNAVYRRDRQRAEVRCLDFDKDGKDEFIIKNNTLSLFLDPEEGGIIKEVDYRPICANLVNTLSRKEEKYHKKMESAYRDKLVYDRYTRYCLRDYFLNEGLKREDFASARFKDYGGFPNGPYTAKEIKGGLLLERVSSINGARVKLSKDVKLKESVIELDYRIEKEENAGFLFGVEFNLTMPYLDSDRYRYFSDTASLGPLDEEGAVGDTAVFGISDSGGELDVKFEFSQKSKEIWYFPVKTVSQSEKGYRLNYQSSCVFPIWRPVLDEKKEYHLRITCKIGQR